MSINQSKNQKPFPQTASDQSPSNISSSLLRQLFDSNLIGVFVSDFAGTFLDANDAFLDLLGYTQDELLAGNIRRDDLTPPELRYLSQNAVRALQETGASDTYEKEYLHKGGRRIPVLVAVKRIEQTDTCIGFVLDITERVQAEHRKDEFIGMVSHELKTPITSLKGFTYVLQRRLSKQGDEQSLHYLSRIDAQLDKLTKLISDLLDITRMQTGKLELQQAPVDLDALVTETVENMQAATSTHQLQLVGRSQARVLGDKDRLGQVFINVLANAIKYSPRADRVVVHLSRDEQHALISIQDFGIGIDDAHQQKVFERFYQVTDPEEKTYPGLGIGLYICRQIIERHHGRIRVHSRKGEGATFSITLPLLLEGSE